MIAQVILDLKTNSLNRCFCYFIPIKFVDITKKGMRVLVPFGKNDNPRLGYIIDLLSQSNMAKKSLLAILDLEPIIDEEIFLLAETILQIPFLSKASVYQTVIPNIFLFQHQIKIKVCHLELVPTIIKDKFNTRHEWLLSNKERIFIPLLKKLSAQKIVLMTTNLKQRYTAKQEIFYVLNPIVNYNSASFNITLTSKQSQLFKKILDEYKSCYILGIKKKALLNIISRTMLSNFLEKEIFLEQKKIVTEQLYLKESLLSSYVHHSDIILNSYQLNVIKQIVLDKYQVYLLYDQPGTNKTGIYLHLIKKVIAEKRQVLILVPEIILITSLLYKLKTQFPKEKIAIIHSLLTSKAKFSQYSMIYKKEALIVLGTRSTIFVPLKDLGLIIIDDEHDESFIQCESAISYDARELACVRAHYHNIALILGSSTPSLESYHLAREMKYSLLKIPDLSNKSSLIKLIDMKSELKKGNLSPFSIELQKVLKEILAKKQQVIILINNKGYSQFLLCCFCGYVPKCPQCNISLTVYRNQNRLKCNYCTYQYLLKPSCLKCNQNTMKSFGLGVEYIENYLKANLPSVMLQRLDSNMVNKISDYEKFYLDFVEEKYQILLGTQMIFKGLDFPKVTLTVVLALDNILAIPHFKGTEKTFQLLKRVIQHSDRNQKGQVIIQSYNVNDNILQNLVICNNSDYILEKILADRKLSQTPPFSYVSKILICHKSWYQAFFIAHQIKNILTSFFNRNDMIVLGPLESLQRIKNNYFRVLLTLKYSIWPLNLDCIMHYNISKDVFLWFDRFAILS